MPKRDSRERSRQAVADRKSEAYEAQVQSTYKRLFDQAAAQRKADTANSDIFDTTRVYTQWLADVRLYADVVRRRAAQRRHGLNLGGTASYIIRMVDQLEDNRAAAERSRDNTECIIHGAGLLSGLYHKLTDIRTELQSREAAAIKGQYTYEMGQIAADLAAINMLQFRMRLT